MSGRFVQRQELLFRQIIGSFFDFRGNSITQSAKDVFPCKTHPWVRGQQLCLLRICDEGFEELLSIYWCMEIGAKIGEETNSIGEVQWTKTNRVFSKRWNACRNMRMIWLVRKYRNNLVALTKFLPICEKYLHVLRFSAKFAEQHWEFMSLVSVHDVFHSVENDQHTSML